MPFDTFRCPQTETEVCHWFYAGIGKVMGEPADDWVEVMENCGLEPGYGPGVRPTASMSNFAITQQYSGGPKARIFLPTDRPDENNYYTRCIQYLDDDASRPGKFVWSWYHIAGYEYVPVEGADPAQPGTGEGISREEVYAILADYFKVGDLVGLQASGGKFLCAENGGPNNNNLPFDITARSEVGPWESFKLSRGQE